MRKKIYDSNVPRFQYYCSYVLFECIISIDIAVKCRNNHLYKLFALKFYYCHNFYDALSSNISSLTSTFLKLSLNAKLDLIYVWYTINITMYYYLYQVKCVYEQYYVMPIIIKNNNSLRKTKSSVLTLF